jgi:hypothetical protein
MLPSRPGCYTARVQDDVWASLAAPFPDDALHWPESGAPHLSAAALRARLTASVGLDGWSCRFTPFGSALICELSILDVTRSVVCDPDLGQSPAALADAALAQAAAQFGLAAAAPTHAAPPATAAHQTSDQTQGQQAIARLIERLGREGRGLEAARLVTRYGGYGSSPDAARELYGQLRALLLGVPGGEKRTAS